jgi:hypothetical protein
VPCVRGKSITDRINFLKKNLWTTCTSSWTEGNWASLWSIVDWASNPFGGTILSPLFLIEWLRNSGGRPEVDEDSAARALHGGAAGESSKCTFQC